MRLIAHELHHVPSRALVRGRWSIWSGPAKRKALQRCFCAPEAGEHFTITTPLYYANAEPHMGGAYSTIAADVAARYQRLRGKRVTLVTGTDEHGEKIAASAAAAGVSPQEHCDAIAAKYRELWALLDIRYDKFVRTTDERHEKVALALLERVWDAGHVYQSWYTGRYCVGCEEYKDADGMDEDGNCLIHRTPCLERKEDNYFFRLSSFTADIRTFLGEPGRVQPARALNEVEGWISEGARDFSISRSAVEWGIKIPRDPAQTLYVWFDALIGYLSALLPEGHEPTAEALTRAGWPAGVHIIGKDILRFHAVYWPGMLVALGLPLPRRVFGHGFLTRDGLKMGKSLGNVLDPFSLTEGYGADAVRFYFMREIPFGQDGDFSEQRFRDVVNAGLANDLGNLVNRCLNLLKKNCSSRFPVGAADVPGDHPLRATSEAAVAQAGDAYERLAFHEAIAAAQSISGRANQLLEETTPWSALKKGSELEKADAALTLVAVLEAARIAVVLMSPVIPGVARQAYHQLGLGSASLEDLTWCHGVAWGVLEPDTPFPQPSPIFQRIEGDMIVDQPACA